MRIYGPATITHGGVAVGKTNQGASWKLNSVIWRNAGPNGEVERVAQTGSGVINLFELAAGYSLNDSLLKSDYAALVFIMPLATLTFPHARLFFPEEMEFGINALKVFKVTFEFRKITAQALLTFS